MTGPLTLIATTAFGLEAVVARELAAFGYGEPVVEDGRVRFTGDVAAIVHCNLWLRSAERVLVQIGEFEAGDFDQLFEGTKGLAWEQWLGVQAAFPVSGRSVKSKLSSVPACQRAVKKAIVERLKRAYQRHWFDEDGPVYPVEIGLLRDRATLTIDTSGDGLHKRGYRRLVGRAPLRETLAAALVQLSYWQRERPLADPFCGSGTIPIEAALIARNIAPGLNRNFASETWPQVPVSVWREARREARRQFAPPLRIRIAASDLDREALRLARKHAEAAGVSGDIHFQQRPVAEFDTSREYGCLICNPPYGERLGGPGEIDALYGELGRLFAELPTWSFYVLTPHAELERLIGREADRRRKLYNARIACTYYQFHGPRPPDAPAS